MSSEDPLTMSLDDIIKMKRQGRRGNKNNQRGRGRGRGRGNASVGSVEQYSEFPQRRPSVVGGRGRGGGGTAVRGRGRKLLSSRLGFKGMAAGRNTAILQGNKQLASRLSGKGNKKVIGEARKRRKGNLSQKPRYTEQYRDSFQDTVTASTSGLQTMRGRLNQKQNAAIIQQINRNMSRNEMVNQRRGIKTNVKTRGNLDAPLRVRVGSGTIVRGLRSDQLLLQKIRDSKRRLVGDRLQKQEIYRDKRDRLHNERDSSLESDPVVSLSSHRGLTVSIKNDFAGQSLYNGISSRNRPRMSRHKSKKNPDDMFAPATFTIVNDRVQLYDSDPEVIPDPSRRITKRNVITAREAGSRSAAPMSLPVSTVRTLPEPHRQILDPKIQKEIALLQGKEEVTLNSGPGPGVKGFRHVPSQTTRSLNERFTNERLVTV